MFKKILAAALLTALLVTGIVVPGSAEINKSKNPLVDAQELVRTHTDDQITNILLLGIEQGTEGQGAPSGNKAKSKQGIGVLAYHTDVVMVLSLNKTQGRINLISIPRDTLVYVPGVYGVYKLNAAFNCATTVKEGFRHACDTVSWLLGGVKIHAYAAVDMGAMVALGDALGGVDLDVQQAYQGTSGRSYQAGMQHLDGMGIMDYVRARHNMDALDIYRTNRGRQAVSAIIQKLWGNWDLVNSLWQTATSGSINFYTDIDASDLMAMYEVLKDLDNTAIGSYMLEGTDRQPASHQTGLPAYYFHIVDQDKRIRLLKDVFNIDAEPLAYVNEGYTRWLSAGWGDVNARYTNDGLDYVRHLHIGQEVLRQAYAITSPSAEQNTLITSFEAVYNDFLEAFENAADRADAGERSATIAGALKVNYERTLRELAEKVGYTSNIYFGHGFYWMQEGTKINEYANISWE